jgi:hypothetical protein
MDMQPFPHIHAAFGPTDPLVVAPAPARAKIHNPGVCVRRGCCTSHDCGYDAARPRAGSGPAAHQHMLLAKVPYVPPAWAEHLAAPAHGRVRLKEPNAIWAV